MSQEKKNSKQSHTSVASASTTHKVARRKRSPSVTTSLLGAITVPTPSVPEIPTATPSSGTLPATTSSSPTASAVTASAPPNALTAPPDVTIPSPPTGFVELSLVDYRGFHVSKKEVAAASTAIADLASFTSYQALLGGSAPEASAVSSALSLGLGWRTLRDLTDTWDAYVRTQDAMAWKAALMLLDELKPLFLIAVAKNPELAAQYAGLARMFAVPKMSAEAAAVTRKKNATAAAAAAAAASTASAVATAKAEATAAVPAKVVTVPV